MSEAGEMLSFGMKKRQELSIDAQRELIGSLLPGPKRRMGGRGRTSSLGSVSSGAFLVRHEHLLTVCLAFFRFTCLWITVPKCC